jgi:Ca2+-binding RTX toxin-like protein
MIKRLFKSRNRKATTRRSMQVEGLESRALLTIGAPTFVLDAGTLYLEMTGTPNSDVFLLGDTPLGDVVFQAWEDWDQSNTFEDYELEQDGTVSAGEIALARMMNGNVPFGGVRVLSGDANDVIDGNVPVAFPYVSPNASITVPSGFGSVTSTADYNIVANGGADNDQIRGSAGRDSLEGGAGNDLLIGGNRPDTMLGGAGDDILVADRFDTLLRGGTGFDTLQDDALGTTATAGITLDNRDIEEVFLDNGAPDRIDNRLFDDSSTAVDVTVPPDGLKDLVRVRVRTFGGNDVIISGAETIANATPPPASVALVETLEGGLGTDTISYEGYSTPVEVNLALQTVVGANDTISGFENATGGSASDILIGSGLANVLIGGDGADTIDGRAGNDSVVGGNGDDVLSGGADNDTVDGGNGADLMDGGNGADSMLGGSGSDTMTGGAGNDYMLGGTDPSGTFFDEVYGQGGNDTIVIPWSYVQPFLAAPTGAIPGAYFGGPGANVFLVGNTPVGVTPADFQNSFDNFVLWLQFNNNIDWGSPNTVERRTGLVL